ncbi:MAG: hypothetical protein AAFZ09_08215, partial [Pseudomonadota bacterium]
AAVSLVSLVVALAGGASGDTTGVMVPGAVAALAGASAIFLLLLGCVAMLVYRRVETPRVPQRVFVP